MKHRDNIKITLIIMLSLTLSIVRAGGDEAQSNNAQLQNHKNTSVSTELSPLSINEIYSKSWAVVIGINQYEKWPGLEYAVNDATTMKNKLKELGFDEIISLTDHQATKQKITQVLGDKLPRDVNKNDRVLIFFAGHGQTEEISDRQYGYIIPVDGEMKNYYSSAISMAQVREFSKRIPAKHIYYIIDACYSGLGLMRSGPGISPEADGFLEKVTSLRAVQMVTAGGKGEQVIEGGNHGLFTEYLLSGLEGNADADNDGILTASEIGSYIRPAVSKASRNKQTPQFGCLEGEGEFVFLLPRAGISKNRKYRDPMIEKRLKELQQREERLTNWQKMLERQTKIAEQNAAREPIPKHNEVAENLMQEQEKGTHKEMMTEIKQKQRSSKSIAKLRDRPETLSTDEIKKMFKSKNFRDIEWNPEGDFPNEYEGQIINGDRVVIDYACGLMWQQSGSRNKMTLDEAKNYVRQLNRDGYAGLSDWRIPTIEELASLLEPSTNRTQYVDRMFDQRQSWCWSSDRKPNGDTWPITFRSGIISYSDRNSKYHVRSVRLVK
jgi:hypothetical protein